MQVKQLTENMKAVIIEAAIPVLEELCQVPSLAQVAKRALDNIRVCH